MGSTKGIAHILYTDVHIVITSPYNAEFVSELKLGLKSRRWNPEKKGWIVDIKERQKLIEIASKFYQVVEDNQPKEINLLNPSSNVEPIETSSGEEIASVIRPGMDVEIWTDGACVVNPGPGGYGIVFRCQERKWEKTGGFQLTTNNRMEIMGVLVALETLTEKCKAIIYSDSQYVVNSLTKGWAKRWRLKSWKKKGNKKVPNADLWDKLLQLCENHETDIRWVKGHQNDVNNLRCDQLAESAARKADLPVDEGYTGNEDDVIFSL